MGRGQLKQKRSVTQKSADGLTPTCNASRALSMRQSEQKTSNPEEAHLLKVLTHLRPGLVHCYDVKGFPRTNNEMERTIRAIKMHYRRISGRKNWNNYLLRYGRCVASSRVVAASTGWRGSTTSSFTPGAFCFMATSSNKRLVTAIRSSSTAFVFVIDHWTILLP